MRSDIIPQQQGCWVIILPFWACGISSEGPIRGELLVARKYQIAKLFIRLDK